MIHKVFIALMLALQFGCSRGAEPQRSQTPAPRLAFLPSNKPNVVVSPEGSAYPGKKWLQDTVTVQNTDERPLYVFGDSLQHVFVQVYTEDVVKNEWASRGLGYCGTGAGYQLVKPRESFTAEIVLPENLSDREYKVELEVYSVPGAGSETIRSQPLCMRGANGR
jgi:hypothetical protein